MRLGVSPMGCSYLENDSTPEQCPQAPSPPFPSIPSSKQRRPCRLLPRGCGGGTLPTCAGGGRPRPPFPPGCVRLPAGLRPFHPLPSLLPTSAFPGLVLTHVPHGPASCWCAPSPPRPHQAQSIFIGSPDRDCPPWLFRPPGPSLASCSLSAQVPTPGHVLTSDCLVLCDLAMGVNQSRPGTLPSLEGRGHRPTSPGHTHDQDLSWVGIH